MHWLIRHHMMVNPIFDMPDKRKRHWFLEPGFEELMELFRADAMGIVPTDLSAYEHIKKLYRHEIAKLKLMPKKLIDGKDVMKLLGLKEGAKVGEILKAVRQAQIEGEIKTSKDAKKFVKNLTPYSSPS